MTEPILVGYNGRPESRDALALAERIAKPGDRPLLLAWVEAVGPIDLPYEVIFEAIQDKAEDALQAVAGELKTRGFDVATRVGLLGSPAYGLQEFAEKDSAALIVVGSSHRGTLGRVLAGTVGTRLLHGSPCPVAVAPRGYGDSRPAEMVRIGVAYDGSAESRLALEWAEDLAERTRATLNLLVVSEDHSTDLVDIGRAKRTHAEQTLAEGLERVTRVRAAGAVKSGLATEHLTAHSANVDLLVVGSRGYGPLRRVLLGSVASHLVTHSHCPVVVTPRAAEQRRHAASPAGVVFA